MTKKQIKRIALVFLIVLVFFVTFTIIAGCATTNSKNTQQQILELKNQADNLQDRINNLEKENGYLLNQVNDLEKEMAKGVFYTIQEAYDAGLLAQDDLMSIAYYNNGGTAGNEDVYPQNYAPKHKSEGDLSEAILNGIKQSYIKTFYSGLNEANADGVILEEYYGIYNGCVALKLSDEYSGTHTAIFYESVGNIQFLINGRKTMIWVKTI